MRLTYMCKFISLDAGDEDDGIDQQCTLGSVVPDIISADDYYDGNINHLTKIWKSSNIQ